MKNPLTFLALSMLAITVIRAQTSEVESTLKRYAELRPREKDLSMYRIDWAPSLKEAQSRALKENRPVFLVIIHAKYGNLFSGHC